jgi:DNA-binding NarL/FixJ family response regulator
MSRIRVLIADDHAVVRTGLRDLVARASDIEVVGEADSGAETLRMAAELTPDLLVLDIEMRDMSGVDVARRLADSGATLPILALSAHDDRRYVVGMLEAGAAGYLLKDEAADTIIEAIRGISRGEGGWLSRDIARRASGWMHSVQTDLSPRELEVLAEVVAGKTNQQIGETLQISEKTVEKHLDSVFTKLQVRSRVEAAVLAVRENLV